MAANGNQSGQNGKKKKGLKESKKNEVHHNLLCKKKICVRKFKLLDKMQ